MRDPDRIDAICNQLAFLWKQTPDWRFTQLLANYNICGDKQDYISYYQEDDETWMRLQYIEDWMEEMSQQI